MLLSLGVAVEDLLDGGVGHAARAADDALAQLVAGDFALGVDFGDAGENEAVFVGPEGAHAGGERGRQHRHGAVRKVDAGAAQARFEIERGAGTDVVADVGDVDLELPMAVREWSDEDGVVEVAGGFAVDGDDGEAAEVVPELVLSDGEARRSLRLRRGRWPERRKAGGACG